MVIAYYKGFKLMVGDPYDRGFTYSYEHQDFDAAPDSGDNRFGGCDTADEVIAEIEDKIRENGNQ